MNHPDEALQRKIENKQAVEDSVDARAYQKVFDALGKEPYFLPSHFADSVLVRLESSAGLSKDYIWLGVGLFAFLIATIVTVMLTSFKIDFGILRFLSSYYSLFIFGVAFILLLQWLDKRIIQKNLQTGQ